MLGFRARTQHKDGEIVAFFSIERNWNYCVTYPTFFCGLISLGTSFNMPIKRKVNLKAEFQAFIFQVGSYLYFMTRFWQIMGV